MGLVEFQPSSWSKGAYLNVSVMWLWDNIDHFAFHEAWRVRNHVSYFDDEQFAPEADELAALAAQHVLEFRDMFTSAADAARYLGGQKQRSIDNDRHAGMAFALCGDRKSSLPFLRRYAAVEDDREWAVRQRQEVLDLIAVRDAVALQLGIESRILSCREALNLGATTGETDGAKAGK